MTCPPIGSNTTRMYIRVCHSWVPVLSEATIQQGHRVWSICISSYERIEVRDDGKCGSLVFCRITRGCSSFRSFSRYSTLERKCTPVLLSLFCAPLSSYENEGTRNSRGRNASIPDVHRRHPIQHYPLGDGICDKTSPHCAPYTYVYTDFHHFLADYKSISII